MQLLDELDRELTWSQIKLIKWKRNLSARLVLKSSSLFRCMIAIVGKNNNMGMLRESSRKRVRDLHTRWLEVRQASVRQCKPSAREYIF